MKKNKRMYKYFFIVLMILTLFFNTQVLAIENLINKENLNISNDLNNEVAINKNEIREMYEGISVTISSVPPTTTQLKKGDVITYTVIIENNTNKINFFLPAISFNIPEGTEYKDVIIDNMQAKQIDDENVGCVGNFLAANSKIEAKLTVTVTGKSSNVGPLFIVYVLSNDKYTVEECSEKLETTDLYSMENIEELQLEIGDYVAFDFKIFDEEYSVIKEINTELGKGISETLISIPDTSTKVKKDDIITYNLTIKNDSEYAYLEPMIVFYIPEGTSFVSVISDNLKNFTNNEEFSTVTVNLKDLEAYSELSCELNVNVNGNTDKIQFPQVLYILINPEYTSLDLLEAMLSEEYIFATNLEEQRAVLGDIAYENIVQYTDTHIFTDEEEEISEPDIETPHINIKQYTIKGELIKNIDVGTKVSDIIDNITTNPILEIKVYKDNVKLQESDIVSTGTILEIGNNLKYTLIVKSDISGDGRRSALDLSLLKKHIVGINELTGNKYEAADINIDDKISATDISQLKLKMIGL